MTSGEIYRLRDVRKSYGTSFQLAIERLDLGRGEMLAVLGPNGAGKSTLLRLLAGLEPCAGELRFDGELLLASSLATRRRITMVFQRPLLLTGSVRFNIEYGLRLRQCSDQRRRAQAIMERLQLAPLAAHPAHTLSGGQAQLVALARALVIDPDVMLLDEPTASLDPSAVALVEQTVQQHQRQRRTTVIWATHNLFQARRVATRTALLLAGSLVEVAATDAFFGAPADPRTAAFVEGRMVY